MNYAKIIRPLGFLVLMGLCLSSCSKGKTVPNYYDWALRTTGSFIQRHPDHIVSYDDAKQKWNYEQGLMLNALWDMYAYSSDPQYFSFIHSCLDTFVTDSGIRTYKYRDFNLDNIGPGRALIYCFERTSDPKYRLAADTLRAQLRHQPRTKDGGFWHKKIYPNQMWLDGLYMAEPFYALWQKDFAAEADYSDIIQQFSLAWTHCRDSKTGLLRHAWNEDHSQFWADSLTGRSPHAWGRALGWDLMALTDVLDIMPADTPGRSILLKQLDSLAQGLVRWRDPDSHLWYQVPDMPLEPGNYLESSSSAMFIYAFAKAARKGWLSPDYAGLAAESFAAFVQRFVDEDEDGLITIHDACAGAGLGGKQRRDGSFAYYMSEPRRDNDYKVTGPFIMAALELHKYGIESK